VYPRLETAKLSDTGERWVKILVVVAMKSMGSSEWYFKNTAAVYATRRFLYDTEPIRVRLKPRPNESGKSKSTRPSVGHCPQDEEEFAVFKALAFFKDERHFV
jgi:hypothetical protein